MASTWARWKKKRVVFGVIAVVALVIVSGAREAWAQMQEDETDADHGLERKRTGKGLSLLAQATCKAIWTAMAPVTIPFEAGGLLAGGALARPPPS